MIAINLLSVPLGHMVTLTATVGKGGSYAANRKSHLARLDISHASRHAVCWRLKNVMSESTV